MRITKWVDFGQEVEVSIGSDDIRLALAEEFEAVTDQDIEPVTPKAILRMVNICAQFLKALTDAQIVSLETEPRKLVGKFLAEQSVRFAPIEGIEE